MTWKYYNGTNVYNLFFQIPFEVELARIHSFEQLFDPSFGDWLKGSKIYDWLVAILHQDEEKV